MIFGGFIIRNRQNFIDFWGFPQQFWTDFSIVTFSVTLLKKKFQKCKPLGQNLRPHPRLSLATLFILAAYYS
jgi:hypothetical protein